MQVLGCNLRTNLTFECSPGIVEGVTEDNVRPLGEWLRNRREELDISLEQADADTRIRARYLEALEAEDLEALPNKVVARGFLRNYAAYLELDPQQAIDRYAAVAGPSEVDSVAVSESSPFDSETFQPVPLHEMPGQGARWWLPVGLLVILVAALALLVWQGYPYISDWLPSMQVNEDPDSHPARGRCGSANCNSYTRGDDFQGNGCNNCRSSRIGNRGARAVDAHPSTDSSANPDAHADAFTVAFTHAHRSSLYRRFS